MLSKVFMKTSAYCYLTATSYITTGSRQTFRYNREPWLHVSSRIMFPVSDGWNLHFKEMDSDLGMVIGIGKLNQNFMN